MILIDRREPPEFYVMLNSRMALPLASDTLEFGDLCWEGYSYVDGSSITVGVERKRIGDLVASIYNGRLDGQLQGMAETYQDLRLIVEDAWRPGPAGEIEVWEGRGYRPMYASSGGSHGPVTKESVMFRRIAGYLTTISIKFGVHVQCTSRIEDTCQWIAAWYHASQEKDHKSGTRLYTPDLKIAQRGGRVGLHKDKPSTLWRMASQLPGVDAKSKNVSEHFSTMENAVLAGLSDDLKSQVREYWLTHPKERLKEWMAIDGIGKKTAEDCIHALTEKGA